MLKLLLKLIRIGFLYGDYIIFNLSYGIRQTLTIYDVNIEKWLFHDLCLLSNKDKGIA